MVNLQDINKASTHNVPLEEYQPTALPVDRSYDPAGKNTISEQHSNGLADINLAASGLGGRTTGPQGFSLAVARRDPLVSHPMRSMSESSKMKSIVKSPGRSLSDFRMLSSSPNNSTPQTSVLHQDLATIASEIEAQGNPGLYRNKDDILLAIRTSAMSLLESNKSNKRRWTDSSSKVVASDPEKPFQCRYCVKKKKTQCELKYHTQTLPL